MELTVLFYVLAINAIFLGLMVVLARNPLFSALFLVLSMMSVAGLFMTLNSTFLAAVQILVYAGAVLVLFVIVLMLFDLKHESNAFAKGRLTGAMKIILCGVLAGLIVGAVLVSATKIAPPSIAAVTSTNTTAPGALEESDNKTPKQAATSAEIEETQSLSQLLFTKYLFAFEMMGLLLLVIPIGVVALSRSAGGTHAKP